MLTGRSPITTAIAVCSLLLAWAGRARASENPYAGAEFTVSSDPSAVVLFVQVLAPAEPKEYRSLRLFGDGRLELSNSKAGASEPLRRERRLDEVARRDLVNVAVSHGLAEWDATRIESEKAIALNGRQLSISDGNVVTVWLTLETYRRNGEERTGVSKQITVATPGMTIRYFPGIPEFGGVRELELYLQGLLKEEGVD